ncbi:MAG: transcription antitermination factor NusB [Caldithrix sp. RBG_13_44_9]|nr:MAG: transcription antitermination factor NusB [Caldithrix sp. RBG_13_44_9]
MFIFYADLNDVDHKDGDQILSRRQSRRFALQVLYSNEFLREDIGEVAGRIAQTLHNEIDEFSREIMTRTSQQAEVLDQMILEGLVDRNINRLAILERVLIRMSLCELLYFPDIPIEVTLNEAVDLSKEFISLKSSRFVNGLLDTLVKKLDKEQKVKKTLLARLPSGMKKDERQSKEIKL